MRLIIAGISILCVVALFTWSYLKSGSAQDIEADATVAGDALGPCDESRYLDYFQISQDIGGLVIGQSPGFEGEIERKALRDAIGEIAFPERRTTFVVAHDPSAKVYTKTCESEPCTLEEISDTETQCLKDNMDFCYFVAVRYQNQTYCTLYGR